MKNSQCQIVNGHRGSGTLYGTIGNGDIACDAGDANRNVEHPRDWHQSYDIKTIHGYIPTIEAATPCAIYQHLRWHYKR